MISKAKEDLQEFVDDMENIFKVMHASDTKGVKFATYQLKGVDYQWYGEWKEQRGKNAEPAMQDKLFDTFLDHFFPRELRKAKVEQFVNIKKGKMSLKEYALKFTQLSYYAFEMVSIMRSHMRKFAFGLSNDLALECKERC